MRMSALKTMLCWGLLVVVAMAARADDNGNNRLGVGAHYWTTVDNLEDQDVDRHGFSWLGSYQYWPSLLGVELDVEWFPEGYAGAVKDVYQPQAYLLFGKAVYAAAGIGGYYSDSTWGDKPFYALRAGLNLELLPSLYLDINGNYRFEDWSNLNASDIKTDTITLGAAVRIAF